MTLSQLALEDVEALYLGPSFLMADPMGPLLDQDEEEALSPSSSLEGKAPASPPLSFSSYASSLSPYQTMSYSPPPSPPPCTSLLLGTKAGADSFPWLGASDLLYAHVGADGSKDDDFVGMDWMSEKIDLNDLDLESLIGSCSSESPSSPDDILASLDSHLDLDTFGPDIRADLSLPTIPCLPLEPTEAEKSEAFPDEEVMKSEPLSPAPSLCPSSPAYTLELGSEVDVLDAERTSTSLSVKAITDPIQTTSPIVSSLSTAPHLTIKSSPQSDSDSDSGFESAAGSPSRLHSPTPSSAGSSRTKPYSKPEPTVSSPSAKVSKVKSVSGAPKVVEKKLKKMEQNKTAATRYRQKKRVEHELLQDECDELEKKNHELKEKADSISREIQYLKDLMEEVRKHRRSKTSSVA